MADAYDFQIDTLKFRLATSARHPYVRSTAPFRKDQFDTSATVGDQSLTGWWTRGQMSFHMGSGIKYYEVLEGEEVLNTFQKSLGVKVFTPGEVLLEQQWALERTTTGNIYHSEGGAYLDGTTNQVHRVINGTQLFTLTSTDVARWFCKSDTYFYVLTSNAGYTSHYIEKHDGFGTSFGRIYTLPSNPTRIWYAKNRLWVMLADGSLHILAAEPTGTLPVAAGPAHTTIKTSAPAYRMSLAAAGPAVYLSLDTGEIYRFTINNDGSVVSLTAPVVAAQMPPGELVQGLKELLGHLIITTNDNVRVATISDGGELTYGPWCIAKTLACNSTILTQGTSAYFIRLEETDSGGAGSYFITELNMERSIPGNPLLYPTRDLFTLPTGTYMGVTERGGQLWAWSDKNLYDREFFTTSASQAGSITTGYHRMGTLDPKRFQKVVVRAQGTGTIEVRRVDASGTEALLGTMTAANGIQEFDLGLTTAVERIALKFTLVQGASGSHIDGPKLLGYQLRALPVPERQRLLRVPLYLVDSLSLRRGSQVGKKGKAYTDLDALEDLERDQAIVTFTDHRTGETGTAYIDQVDFQGETPAGPNDNGFGGIAYVTLRVLE